MFEASFVEGTLRITHLKFKSWEDLEVKIRESLMNALELDSIDEVSIDFDLHGEVAER